MLKILGATTLVWLLVAAPVAADQKLVDFQRVVTVDRPSAVEKAAAGELAEYVGRITGRKLPLVSASQLPKDATGLSFFVGAAAKQALDQDPAPWKPEEYLLRTVPKGLILAGDDAELGNPWAITTHAGSMLAVYTLLDDHLGVHWFWPGPFGEHVPDTRDAVIPTLNVRATPKFRFRSINLGYTTYHTPEYRLSHFRWLRRNRLGSSQSAVFGHAWFDAFLRDEENFKSHPEWFALVNGKRMPPQMCTTNPDVIEHMVQHVLAGKYDVMHISPSDGGGFCTCERCRALDVPGLLAYDNVSPLLSDRIFTYANEVARQVRSRNPAKGVGMLAYTYYNRPPTKIQALEPNLYVSFAYQAAGLRDPEALAEWRTSAAGWKKLGAKLVAREAWGLHYYTDLPFPQEDLILSNLREAYQAGFLGATGDGSKAFATQAPNYWALTRALWDPERDAGNVMEEYYRSAYGPAAADMQAFFRTYGQALDANWSKRRRIVDTSLVAYANILSSWHLLYPAEVIGQAEKHLQAAERKVSPGEYADRVAFHRFGQDYTVTMLELFDHYRRLGELGVPLEFFASSKENTRQDAVEKKALLLRAHELGEQRERMLLQHRDWAAVNEGLYAYLNDKGIRQWHAVVKKELGINQPTALTKAKLDAKK